MAKPLTKPRHRAQVSEVSRQPPHSASAEEHVLACILLEGDNGLTLKRALEAGITPESFHDHKNRAIFEICCTLTPPALETLVIELQTRRQLEAVGGLPYLLQITSQIPTTAHAGPMIAKVKELHALRETIKAATRTVEEAYGYTGGLEEFLASAESRIAKIRGVTIEPSKAPDRPLFEFPLVLDGDQSILLGDRYLNRGDGAVIVSTSGMGKSTIALQGAAELALQLGPFGIQGNGPLSSLIIQSEDSEGDIAEVAHSLKHVLKLTPEQVATVNAKVHIVTDRVNRGVRFITALKKLIALHKPDLVWINPLQAFMDGDVTEGKDLGAFLREGLNSLNQPPTFGYIIIHHTTKPATGKERHERLWHEVMYDMAGGAEIINWARAIISLRPTATEGEFNLVLAKRGRRAGVTKKVPNGVGVILEPVTSIPLKHSTGRIEIPGIARGLPLVYWLPRETTDAAPEKSTTTGGRKEKYSFKDFRQVLPASDTPGKPFNEILRAVSSEAGGIPKGSLQACLNRWAEDGDIQIVRHENEPSRYRRAL